MRTKERKVSLNVREGFNIHPAREEPRESAFRDWVRSHPVLAFFGLTYAVSWLAWIPWALGYQRALGAALFIVGGFGPAVSAAVITRYTGGSVAALARRAVNWRALPRYYLYALGLPGVLLGAVNLELALLGQDVDLSLLPGRLPSYFMSFAFIAILGGGLEEAGWRGFALPRLEGRFSPLRATLVLGFAWGVWHIPAYGTPLAIVFPLVLAFFYTWLYNRSGSILLCILLHASFTPTLELFVLTRDSMTVDVAIFATSLAAALALILITRGRLGYPPGTSPVLTGARTSTHPEEKR